LFLNSLCGGSYQVWLEEGKRDGTFSNYDPALAHRRKRCVCAAFSPLTLFSSAEIDFRLAKQDYTEAEAKQAFIRVAQFHGWKT
jgi:hypothetical protein